MTAAPVAVGNLAELLELSAAEHPERLAVQDASGASLNYRELNRRADRVSAYLASVGVGRGDRVGLALPKTFDTVTAIFGVLKAGAAYVPVDWKSPEARIRSIFSDCAVKVIVADARVASVAMGYESTVAIVTVGGETPVTTAWESILDFDGPAPQIHDRSRNDLAYILYTSGSTGIPKGVILTQENALSFVDWCSSIYHPTPEDRFSSHAPFHFDLSILDIYVPLKHGASLHLIPDELGKNPKELAQFIAERKLTMWYSTPSVLTLLATFGGIEKLDCSSLRVVNFAGEVFPVKQLRNLTKLWPHPEYYNLYGPTETNVCTFAKIPLPVPEERTQPYPIGPGCAHCECLVLDTDGQEVVPGGEGLLYIAGPSVFQGYWNRPKENAAAFIERNGKRWYNTGDVVREDPTEGYIYAGRRDRMVKRRGFRIELDEIEKALYRHENVHQAAVVAAPDASAGVKIAAFLAPRAGKQLSIIEMKTFCGANLPSYMNPDVFLFLDVLPKTSTDKMDYQGLLRHLEAPKAG